MKDVNNSMRPADTVTTCALITRCQENGWLKFGGYPWQDDPYLEEYPFEFSVVDDVNSLRAIFTQGNWAIRQGFIYEDLAFIQQVDGGDEWWTLKNTGTDWLAFESWSFGSLVHYPTRFEHAIACMHAASPEQCERLEYMKDINSPHTELQKESSSDKSLQTRAQETREGSAALSDSRSAEAQRAESIKQFTETNVSVRGKRNQWDKCLSRNGGTTCQVISAMNQVRSFVIG